MQIQPNLYDRIQALTGVNIDELVEQVRFSGLEWGRQKAACEHLERHRKTLISAIMQDRRAELAGAAKKPTNGELEDFARSHDKYREHCKTMHAYEVRKVELETNHFALRNRLNALIEGMKLVRAEAHLQQSA